jgi:hypothetical protein
MKTQRFAPKVPSIIAITPCYVFALSQNAPTGRRKVVASYRYRSGLIGKLLLLTVIALGS